MSDLEIKGLYKMLKANYSHCAVILPAPSCIIFRGVPLRFGRGWVRLKQETYPCQQPGDVIRILLSVKLISEKALIYLNSQIPYFINKPLNK